MKIAVSGSTGFIGKALTAALSARGDVVAAVGRRTSRAERDAAVDGAAAVINLAGENIAAGRWTAARKRAVLESRVGMTRALVESMARAAVKPGVLVNASAVGYYGVAPDGVQDEGAPMGTGFLAEVCAAWEAEARRAEALGARVALARLGVVLGRGGGALPKMALPFKLFAGGPVGSGEQPVPWVHLDDAVGALLFAAQTPGLAGPINVVSPECPRQRDFAKALGRALHRPSWAPAPAFALRLALGEMADMLLGGQRAEPRKLAAAGYRFKKPGLDEALRDALT